MVDKKSLEEIKERKKEKIKKKLDKNRGRNKTIPDNPIHIKNEDELNKAIDKYDVVLVDFFAEWCGPCKRLSPILEEIAKETDTVILKIDIDSKQNLAQKYRVQSVPTNILFYKGKKVEKLIGLKTKNQIKAIINNYK